MSTTCGHDEVAFATIYHLDALAVAATACGLLGSCLDHSTATIEIEWTIDDRGTRGFGFLLPEVPCFYCGDHLALASHVHGCPTLSADRRVAR